MTCCHSANPEKILKDYFFTVLVDFRVPFWINFLSSSEFFSFRKGMEQDTMFSSVSVVQHNSVLTCNIYTGIEVLQSAVIFPDKGTYYMNM